VTPRVSVAKPATTAALSVASKDRPSSARGAAVRPLGTVSAPVTAPVLANGRRSMTELSERSPASPRVSESRPPSSPEKMTSWGRGDSSERSVPDPPPSPVRPSTKLPLSRESSAEPPSPTTSPAWSPVRRQVGIIKPTRKTEHRDEFNRRKNTLNHVKNSVVEKEIAVIGTEYLKRKDREEAREAARSVERQTSADSDTSPPALPPRRALVVEPKKSLESTTAPPRPAPFQGVVLKPVPKQDLPRPAQTATEPPPLLKPQPHQANVVRPEPVLPLKHQTSNTKAESGVPGHVAKPEPVLPAHVNRQEQFLPAHVTKPEPVLPAHVTKPHCPPPALTPMSRSSSASVTAPKMAAVLAPVVTRPAPPVTRPQPAPAETVTPAVTSQVVASAPGQRSAPDGKKWHQAADSSMVFNFTSNQGDVPDYVEDDGLILRRRLPKAGDSGYAILPGFDPGESCDDDLTSSLISRPPSPCNVVFTNADIIIGGKSSLMKKPKTRKLAVSFSQSGPLTHEYVSEASLLTEDVTASNGTSSASNGAPSAAPAPLRGLASYTPSKLAASSDFELGVSRLNPAVSAPGPSARILSPTDEFLKPADDADTVAWSSEMSADILF